MAKVKGGSAKPKSDMAGVYREATRCVYGVFVMQTARAIWGEECRMHADSMICVCGMDGSYVRSNSSVLERELFINLVVIYGSLASQLLEKRSAAY